MPARHLQELVNGFTQIFQECLDVGYVEFIQALTNGHGLEQDIPLRPGAPCAPVRSSSTAIPRFFKSTLTSAALNLFRLSRTGIDSSRTYHLSRLLRLGHSGDCQRLYPNFPRVP